MLGGVSWALVVGCGCVVKLFGISPRTDLSFPLPPPWLCCLAKVWASSSVVVAVCSLFDRCACDVDSKKASFASTISVLVSVAPFRQ